MHSVSVSRMVVCFYQGTSFLEMLATNVPVVCYMDGLNELREDAAETYQILIDVGVCHTSISSLVDVVNSNWDNCLSWWYSDIIQDARAAFCHRHLRVSKYPSLDLKEILLSNVD